MPLTCNKAASISDKQDVTISKLIFATLLHNYFLMVYLQHCFIMVDILSSGNIVKCRE